MFTFGHDNIFLFDTDFIIMTSHLFLIAPIMTTVMEKQAETDFNFLFKFFEVACS